MKTVEESACIRGYDAHKCVKGRKRHLLVDTLGLPIAHYVTPADVHDTVGARQLLQGLACFVPRLKKIWADAAYRGKELAEWCQQQGDAWELEVVERAPGTRGFNIQPRRWVVERCFAWLSRNRRMARDFERMVQTSGTLIELAASRLVLRRLARHTWYADQTPPIVTSAALVPPKKNSVSVGRCQPRCPFTPATNNWMAHMCAPPMAPATKRSVCHRCHPKTVAEGS